MRALFELLRLFLTPRASLIAENVALRQQLATLKRDVSRPRLRRRDRLFWVFLRRVWPSWRDSLVIIKPSTVVRWHRHGWRLFWRMKSRKHGRPLIPRRVITLIHRMSEENPLWGAPRIQAELRLLGIAIAESTVAKYMVTRIRPGRGQRWHTFLRNHARQIVACDLLVVPTLTFRRLFVFVVLDHERRRILHIGVTTNPTAVWLAAQIRSAFVRPEDRPRFLLRDRDGAYGRIFDEAVEAMGIRTLRTTPRSPWQNAYVERVIGSIRRECLNHVIVLSQAGLRAILAEYVVYYNAGRAHQGLAGERPISRPRRTRGRIVARPVLGGLHHVYDRAA